MLLESTLTVGQRFKHIRMEKGFSQSELAEGICSASVISQIECDRKYPSAEMLGKLADKLNVPLREIMGMQEKQLAVSFQIEIIRVHTEKADYAHALELIDDLALRDDLLEHQRIELLVYRVECKLKSGKYREAMDLLLPFLEKQQIQQTINDELLCDMYNKLGTAYYRLNDFEKAFSTFEQGYRVSLKLQEYGLTAARVTKNLGLTCNQLGFLTDARKYLEKAYSFYERVSDTRGIASTLFDLAVASGELEHLKIARSMYESLNMVVEANLAKLHYAFFVESKRDYDVALNDFNSSAAAFERVGQHGLAVYTRSRAAMICIDLGDLTQAKRYLNEAESVLGQMTEHNDIQCTDFYKSRSTYHLLSENFDRCILDSQIASEMCDRMGLYSEAADALQISAEAYTRQGLHKEASHVYQQVVALLRKNSRGGLM